MTKNKPFLFLVYLIHFCVLEVFASDVDPTIEEEFGSLSLVNAPLHIRKTLRALPNVLLHLQIQNKGSFGIIAAPFLVVRISGSLKEVV